MLPHQTLRVQFARVKAMEMEHSVQLTSASHDDEPAAKKPKEDVPEVRPCSKLFQRQSVCLL